MILESSASLIMQTRWGIYKFAQGRMYSVKEGNKAMVAVKMFVMGSKEKK